MGTYRGAFANEATAGVTGNRTRSTIPAGLALAAVHHGVAAAPCRERESQHECGVSPTAAGFPGREGRREQGGALTCIPRPALALVIVDALHAVLGAARVAGVGQALVDVPFAALPNEAGRADAAVAAHPVRALAVVEALGPQGDRVEKRAAVINIDFTVHPWGEREGAGGNTVVVRQ